MGLGCSPTDPKRSRYFHARVTGSCKASYLIFARSERPRGWLRRDQVAGRCEGAVAFATKEGEATPVAVRDSYVKHPVTVEIGGVQALGLAANFASERPAV